MIVITGAAGFIASCLASTFLEEGNTNVLLVDDFTKDYKSANLLNTSVLPKMDRMEFLEAGRDLEIEAIFHLGARTDTTEFDTHIFDKLNVAYSKSIWQLACDKDIPLIYASSAATYGNGDEGFNDDPSEIENLKPLNPYGQSKHDFDLWAMKQTITPPFWIGLKFFNVFGPNEYHKSRMASVVYHTFQQIKQTGEMKLFQSHHPDFKDGEQSRDFIYVKDVLSVLQFWYKNQNSQNSGIYNLGTGSARTFLDLARATFTAMKLDSKISFIPTPQDLRTTYQYYTCADMKRTIEAGYKLPFTPLEKAVEDYVQEYLIPNKYI